MRHLYLIRHATPEIQPNVPSVEWNLSERGFEEARALGATAQSWGLHAIYASSERKAQSTALAMSELLDIPVHVVEGLEELRIDGWIGNSDEFGETVQQILQEPDLSLRGAERASVAAERFARGVAIVEQAQFPAAVVSHGRVLTAWLAHTGRTDDAFALWRSIPMPGWARIDLDDAAAVPVFLG
jgi:broad specificity phosphatase PhoE